jgi:hypothetical protein
MDSTDRLATEPGGPKTAACVHMAFSYDASHRHVTEQYLSDAFAPGCATHFDLDAFGSTVSILRLLEYARSRNEVPDIFGHLVHAFGLPRDLQRSPIPTASLDIDSFGWT